MIRVKDPKISLDFYQYVRFSRINACQAESQYRNVMGMKLKRTSENEAAKFNLYFLAYGANENKESANGVNPLAGNEGLLE